MARISQVGVERFNGSTTFPAGETGTVSAKIVVLTDGDFSETVRLQLSGDGQVIAEQTVTVPAPGEGFTLSGTFTVPNAPDFQLCGDIV